MKPKNEAEKQSAEQVQVALGLVAGGGEGAAETEIAQVASKSETIAQLTKEAETAYPKLAAKVGEELHHIVPKYLGGTENGETVALRPAYHQLITNEFRRLAPYGQSAMRSAAEVAKIVQQVYLKFPLP